MATLVPQPVFIGSEIYRDSSYGRGHPLAIPRVSLAIDLMRALDWFPDGSYLDSPAADKDYLARFHTPEYIEAVIRAEQDQDAPEDVRTRHNIGVNGNPIFPEMFRRPATATGGGRLAAERVRDGGIAYNLGGGQHHGRPDQASGFCYFNEPVLTIGKLLDDGCERVFYLDLDAHHGDGVQDAFDADERVFTLSIHEGGRWPMRRHEDILYQSGGLLDRGQGAACNVPVPEHLNDDEFEAIIEGVVLPHLAQFNPDAVFVQAGADALEDDPQSKLKLSNGAIWRAVTAVIPYAERLIVSGGGGYNPYSLARCWAGIWATLSSQEIPAKLPDNAVQILASVDWQHRRAKDAPPRWTETLLDPPNNGPIRDLIRSIILQAAAP